MLNTKKLGKYIDGRGIIRYKLALLAGVSPTTISRLEHGKTHPKPETMRKICKALHCRLSDICELNDKAPEDETML